MDATELNIEKLLTRLRAQLSKADQKVSDIQQHIDLVRRGQLDMFPPEDPPLGGPSKKASK